MDLLNRTLTHMFILCLFFCGSLYSQRGTSEITANDGLLMKAVNDTGQLREITMTKRGTPAGARAQNLLGKYFYRKHQSNDAEKEFQTTYKQYPNTPEAKEAAGYLGKFLYWKDRFDDAKPYFKEYLQANPAGPETQWMKYCLLRSMFYTRDSSYLSAASEYFASQHDSTRSKDDLIQYDVIRYLASIHQYDKAIAEATSLINRHPSSQYISLAEKRIAEYHLLNRNPQGAINQCLALLSKYPPNTDDAARAQDMLASYYLYLGNYDKARQEYSKVALNHPAVKGWVDAAECGLAFVDLQEGTAKNDTILLAKARLGLQRFVENHPHHGNVPNALMSIADLSNRSHRYREVISAYDGVIGFDWTLADTMKLSSYSDEVKGRRDIVMTARLAKGAVLRSQLHDSKAALQEYEAVLATDPMKTDALFNKALCLVDLGEKQEARKILERLVIEKAGVKDVAAQILNSL